MTPEAKVRRPVSSVDPAATVAVVAHDAGGAEILSSYLRRNGLRSVLVAGGPTLKIFERKLGPVRPVSLQEALGTASWMLCGTSWQSDLEWRAIGLARAAKLHTVAFLDHWENYRQRFIRAGKIHLPDELWVTDEYAAGIAARELAEVPVRVMGNPYFDDIQAEIDGLESRATPAGSTLLFLCEPVREHALRQHGDERYWGYVEEDAVQFFLANLQAISPQIARIIVRPHPSEAPGKYSWVAARTSIPVRVSLDSTLVEDIAAADIVVGIESMAMVVALVARKRVISAIPPGGRRCVLPHKEIESLSDLVASHIN